MNLQSLRLAGMNALFYASSAYSTGPSREAYMFVPPERGGPIYVNDTCIPAPRFEAVLELALQLHGYSDEAR